MSYVAAYIAILMVFGAADAVWLNVMGNLLYRPVLGNIMLDSLRLGPGLAYYLLFPIGLILFGVSAGIRSGSVGQAALYGALFGAFAYGTYDLTNYATLRNWNLQVTLVDMAYGAAISAVSAAVGYLAWRWWQGA